MVEDARLSQKYAALLPHLNERQRRFVATADAGVLGSGGLSGVARAAEVGRTPPQRGWQVGVATHVQSTFVHVFMLVLILCAVSCTRESATSGTSDPIGRDGLRITSSHGGATLSQEGRVAPPTSSAMAQGISDERSGTLSSHLSPRAKREMLLSPADKRVSALVSVASSVDRGHFTQSVGRIGGDIVTWSDTTNLVTITIPAGALNTLAGMEGVVYVETGGHYGR